jgi:guanylate kinase
MSRGFILILSGPSGSGKTTITKALLAQDAKLCLSTSATTRNPRPGELDGKDYFFLTNDRFEELIEKDHFLEHAKVFQTNRYYGTPRDFVEQKLESGLDALFDIDWQGMVQVKERMPHDVETVFILPPSMEELEKRLRNRMSDSDEDIKIRLEEAKKEIEKQDLYDHVIVNHNLNESIRAVKKIIEKRRSPERARDQ